MKAVISTGEKIKLLRNIGEYEKDEILTVTRNHGVYAGEFVVDDCVYFNISGKGTDFEVLGEEPSLDKHYDFFYDLTPFEGQYLQIKLDPYKVSSVWKLGEKDNTGCIFHILKTIARFGQKNDKEREIRAIHATIKRLAEIEGINLDE